MPPLIWADGYGRWHAEVDYGPQARRHAREAIRAELAARGALGDGYRLHVVESDTRLIPPFGRLEYVEA